MFDVVNDGSPRRYVVVPLMSFFLLSNVDDLSVWNVCFGYVLLAWVGEEVEEERGCQNRLRRSGVNNRK